MTQTSCCLDADAEGVVNCKDGGGDGWQHGGINGHIEINGWQYCLGDFNVDMTEDFTSKGINFLFIINSLYYRLH